MVDFAAVLLALAAEVGITRPQAWGDGVGETLRLIGLRLKPRHNAGFVLGDRTWFGGQDLVSSLPLSQSRLHPWISRDEPVEWFPPGGHAVTTPKLSLVRLPGGCVAQVGTVPVVVAGDGRTIVREVSSRYASLLHFVPVNLTAVLDGAREVAGRVFLLGDDVWPPNYSHWLLDTLPRLAVLAAAGLADAALATGPLTARFQRETLAACGWDTSRIIELAPGQALRAGELLATTDQPQPPHPMFKGSAWAARYLRRTFGPPDGVAPGRRLYISRNDAPGRHVLNEAELVAALALRGFEGVALGGMTVPEQAALFASAAWIVAPHGAGLSNLVFAPPGATVLELFPRSYGTSAYFVIAAAGRLRYGCQIGTEEHVVRRDTRPRDDFSVDVGQLLKRYSDLLPG